MLVSLFLMFLFYKIFYCLNDYASVFHSSADELNPVLQYKQASGTIHISALLYMCNFKLCILSYLSTIAESLWLDAEYLLPQSFF